MTKPTHNPYQPPQTNPAPHLRDQPADAPVALWNPAAVRRWSILFTPVFGALLLAANWRALGQPENARRSGLWVLGWVAGLALLVALTGLGALPPSALIGGSIGLLFAWYHVDAGKQLVYVTQMFGDDYPRRGWAVPLVIAGVVALAIHFALGAAISHFAALGRPDSPPY